MRSSIIRVFTHCSGDHIIKGETGNVRSMNVIGEKFIQKCNRKNLEGSENLGDPGIDWRKILKERVRKWFENVELFHLDHMS
jgi:hypothetical protein